MTPITDIKSLKALSVTTKEYVMAVLTFFDMIHLQGLTTLQMAFRRCHSRGHVTNSNVIDEFERMIQDMRIENPRPLPGYEDLEPLAYDIRTSLIKPKLVSSYDGLPIGVEPKPMRVSGVQVPSAVVELVLVRMFNGEPFKSRDICPRIEDILGEYLDDEWPDHLAYHIACRLVSSHKAFLLKQGTTYQYV